MRLTVSAHPCVSYAYATHTTMRTASKAIILELAKNKKKIFFENYTRGHRETAKAKREMWRRRPKQQQQKIK